MSTDRRDDDDEEYPLPDDMPDREDGSVEFDQRTALRVMFNDPAVRNYVFAALGGLVMIALILLQLNADIGALMILGLGVAGLLFRWIAIPPIVLVQTMYFMWSPTGVPGEGYENAWEIEEGRFRVADVLLTMSILVYVTCQYRIYGLVLQAIAWEGMNRRKGEPVTRRPAALIRPTELGILIGVCGGLVVAGQLIWWLVNGLQIDPVADFPFKAAEAEWTRRSTRRSYEGLPPGATRFMLIVGLLLFGTLLARLVYGYWRLRMMGPAEGSMMLLDAGWAETSRERSRLEKWRIWGRKRAEAQAKKAEAEAKKAERKKVEGKS